MNTLFRFAILAVGTLTLARADADSASEQYLCVPDQSTGFSFSNGGWHPTNFRTGDKKYLVRRTKTEDDVKDAKWLVVELGSDYPTAVCEKDFNEAGFLFCEGILRWSMGKKSLRFLGAYLFGFYDGKDNNENTPFIT